MRPAAKRRLKNFAIGYLYSLAGAIVFMLFIRNGHRNIDRGDVMVIVGVPALLTFSVVVIELTLVPWTRRIPFLLAVVLRGLSYCVAIAASIAPVVWLVNIYMNGWVEGNQIFTHLIQDRELLQALIYGCEIIFAFTFLTAISQKLGPGVMLNWILGRYHHPRTEERIFMFLDLRGSTALAAKLGSEKYSRFVQDFFRDMTEPLRDHDAEVSHFIGDEVVLSWPMKKGLEDAKCVRCFFAVKDEIARRSSAYRQAYGEAPAFKAGAHCGPVVATDVGVIKSEIVYHGDVLNVASRLQSLCNEENAELLISGDLAALLPDPADVAMAELGNRELKGRLEPIDIVRCDQKSPGSESAP